MRPLLLAVALFSVVAAVHGADLYTATGGVQYEWIDLRNYNDSILLNASSFGVDSCSNNNITFGFSFPFFNKTYSSVRLSKNGFLLFAGGLCVPVSDLPASCASPQDDAYTDGIQFVYSAVDLTASGPAGSNVMMHASFTECPYSPESSYPCWILMLYRISWTSINIGTYIPGPTVELILSGNGDVIVQMDSKGDQAQWSGIIARAQGIEGVDSSLWPDYSIVYPSLQSGTSPEAQCPWAQAGSAGSSAWPIAPSAFVFLPPGNVLPCPPDQYPNSNSTACLCYDYDSDGSTCDDECPNDPAKVEPGVCGCGEADVDTDSDGTPDCEDECPEDPLKQYRGFCDCGSVEIIKDDNSITCSSFGAASALHSFVWDWYPTLNLV